MDKSTIILSLIVYSSNTFAADALLLFAGKNHDEFIGCLNCSSIDDSSVCNSIGKYGSSISDKSIWNSIGDYGSTISSKSPWNTIAQYPPVIVDKNGNFYGYLTANTIQSKRTNNSTLQRLTEIANKDLNRARELFCE